MRDKERIEKVLKQIEEYWLKVPDWRLGQLIENVKIYTGYKDLFFIEDDDLLKLVEEFFIKHDLMKEKTGREV